MLTATDEITKSSTEEQSNFAAALGFAKFLLESLSITDLSSKHAEFLRRPTAGHEVGKLEGGNATPPGPPGSWPWSGTNASDSPTPSSNGIHTTRINKTWASDLPTKLPQGLKNPGVMCYRNAILQCLLHQPAFYHYLDKAHWSPRCDGHWASECTICALRTLWEAYWHKETLRTPPQERGLNSETGYLNEALLRELPEGFSDLKKDLRSIPPKQSDPFESWVHILECLKEHEKRDAARSESLDVSSAPGIAAASQTPSLSELFDVTLEQRWQCEDCGHITSIMIPAAEAGDGTGLKVNLQELCADLSLVEYLTSNTFKGSTMIRCENGECRQVVGQTEGKLRQQESVIRKAPEVLVVRLGRFKHNANNESVKWSNDCHFEEHLDLGGFTEEREPLLYRLDGVVAHKGTLEDGHYIASVRGQDETNFRTINDGKVATVLPGTFRLLQCPILEGGRFDPYVLVYSKL